MSRYLYRAKTRLIVGTYNFGKEDGEWVKGYLYCDTGRWMIKQFEFDRADHLDYEVDPSTICQCTGLKDKNETLIFENDIAWDSEERKFYKIIFSQEDMCYYVQDADGYKHTFESYYGSSIEVESNIFDNPELLEVDNA